MASPGAAAATSTTTTTTTTTMTTTAVTGPVTTQPVKLVNNPEDYIRKLEVDLVEKWSVSDVYDKFLQPLGYAQLQETFRMHNVTGSVLLSLHGDDLKDMNVWHVGDRLFLETQMFRLRTEKRRRQNERPLWEGVAPAGSCAYYDNPAMFLKYKCCPCFFPFKKLRVSSQGLRTLQTPPFCNTCCSGVRNDFQDFRLLKTVEHNNKRSCCVDKNIMTLTFENSTDSKGGRGPKEVVLEHPELNMAVVKIIRDAWYSQRLVAD